MTETSPTPRRTFRSTTSSLIGFLRRSEDRSNGAFLAVAIAAFLVPWGASKALDSLWERVNPDETDKFLGQISEDAKEIKSSVETVSDALKNVQAEIPKDQYSAIMGMLETIDAKAATLEPIATRLAAASKDYVNGAIVSDGPYTGHGSFFMDKNKTSPDLTKQICGSSTVSYDPASSYKSVSLNVGGKRYGGFPNGEAITSQDGTWVTVSPVSQGSAVLQVFYDCASAG